MTGPGASGDIVVVGAGLGGMAAAIVAADRGLRVRLVEKAPTVGGAASYSGGQVWVGANDLAAAQGLDDSIDATLAYVQAAAANDAVTVDSELALQWITAARDAVAYFQRAGVIEWEVIPDYPDYYYPDLPGSRATGRYLTGAPFDGATLGQGRARLHTSPHFPVGITYPEMFSWGGMSSRTRWDWDLVARRRDEDVLTFGTGIAAAFFRGVLDRDVEVMTETEVTGLVLQGAAVVGARARTASGEEAELTGPVILATGAHDWSRELTARFTTIAPADGGSVAPSSLSGDAIHLVEPAGGSVAALPPWAAPVLPGYRLSEPAFPGDTGYRACYEHCLPHTFLVNAAGERFCDDSFHPSIVRAALASDDNLPFFMVWDAQHHATYGLGPTMPGGTYPDGLVTEADSVDELARRLGINPAGLAETTERFNATARTGADDPFGRGTNLSVRRFRGDGTHQPNPCVGPVDRAPYFGMRMRLLSTGIATAGVRAGPSGRVLDADGRAIPGLYAVGECAARAAAGVGYNSGYSLSRAMAFGFLAAHEIADHMEGT